MDINQFTKNAYQILDGYLSRADWKDIVEDIYSDGFVDDQESNLLYGISRPDERIRKDYFARAGSPFPLKNEARNFLDYKMFLKDAVIEEYLEVLPTIMGKPNTPTAVTVELSDVQDLDWGGIKLTIKLAPQSGREILTTITLPDENNYYPGDFARDFDTDTLSGIIKYKLSEMAVSKAASKAKTDLEKDKFRIIAERLGYFYTETLPPLDDSTTNAIYTIEDSYSQRVAAVAKEASNEMKLAPQMASNIQTTAEVLPEALAAFPDYVQAAFTDLNPTILYFETAEVFPKLLADGSITESPNASGSFTNSPVKPGDPSVVYMNATSSNVASNLSHELGHVVQFSLPAEMGLLFDPFYGSIGRLYAERYTAANGLAERGFATTYQANEAADYFAEAFQIFYEKSIIGNSLHTGTLAELMLEDPKLYLLLIQLDTLLKAHHGSDKNEAAPPIWAAFTQTALTQNEIYFKAHEQDWFTPENLDHFRNETLALDISDEIAFWNDYQIFYASENIPADYNAASNDFYDLAARLALKNPDFKLANYFGMQSKGLEPVLKKQLELTALQTAVGCFSTTDWMMFFKTHFLAEIESDGEIIKTAKIALDDAATSGGNYPGLAAWFDAEIDLLEYKKTRNPEALSRAEKNLYTAINSLPAENSELRRTMLIRLAQILLLQGKSNWMGYCEVLTENGELPTDGGFSAFPRLNDKKIARKIAKEQELTSEDWKRILNLFDAALF